VSFENRYSWLDRTLHRFAFATPGLQVALADIEQLLYKNRLNNTQLEPPVFITALPRAGTTILLNVLFSTGRYASHTYEDMPFVLCPLLWNSLSGRLRRPDTPVERAHGDGLTISLKSPEAFEEMIWRYFWPSHYKSDRIDVWHACNDADFEQFLSSHLKKIVALRRSIGNFPVSYISKNNLNIARLQCLPKILPNARIIVPYRHPTQHAASLLKEHLLFLELHRKDSFSSQYMRGIGHLDFGEHFRPIDFGKWLKADRRQDAQHLGFWLEYWIAAYRSVQAHAGPLIRLLSYRRLTSDPSTCLRSLASFLGIKDANLLIGQAAHIRPPREHEVALDQVPSDIIDEANEVYRELECRSEA